MKQYKGFTLVELLLYIAIVVIVVGAIVMFLFVLQDSQVRNKVIAEVEQQGIQAIQEITKTIENARRIASPSPGSGGVLLELFMEEGDIDKIVFYEENGVLWEHQDLHEPVRLMNSRVQVSDLRFQNLATNGSPTSRDIIRVEFLLTYITATTKQIYNYSQHFYGSAILRQ